MSDSTRTFPVALPEDFDVEELMSLVPADMWEKDEKAAAVLALQRSGKFDEEWYLNRYPDVKDNEMRAIDHYVKFGAVEGRSFNYNKKNEKTKISIEKNNFKYNLGIIILNLNGANLLSRLFESINRYKPILSFHIFVTDHNSTDDSRAVIEYWSKILPIEVEYAECNYTFSYSNNRWAKCLSYCEKLLFLNNDIIFEDNVLDGMAKVLDDPNVGVVGIDQVEEEKKDNKRRWHHRGIGFNWDAQYHFWRPFNIQSSPIRYERTLRIVPAITGSVMMVRRNDFIAVNCFDEGYNYGYEDIDLCLTFASKLRKKTVCINSDKVIHSDGMTRKKIKNKELVAQRIKNIELLKNKFSGQITRLHRRMLFEEQTLSQKAPRVVFAVSEIGDNASAGDYFTAIELGRALEQEFGWSIDYQPRGEQWYSLLNVDIVIAMVDNFDPRKIKEAHPGLIKVAWARNWFERWCSNDWYDEYDLYLASSKRSADYIFEHIGQYPRILRIAANPLRFNLNKRNGKPSKDFIFTGNYWNADREIVHALKDVPKNLMGAIYGKNWEKVPQVASLSKGFVTYNQLADLYSDTKIVIDDANHVTKTWGSVNSRVFDALAAGCLVITNSEHGSEDAFKGQLPVYKNPEHLKELLNHFSCDETSRGQAVNKLRRMVLSLHTYTQRAYEFKSYLREYFSKSLRIAIKLPVPKREIAEQWGDYHFAESLARELRTMGNSVRIDFLFNWERGDFEGDDVTLVLRGLSRYRVRSNQYNVLWLISHPDKVTDEEINGYDLVFVASKKYANELSYKLQVPIETLLQCTDSKRFNPSVGNDPNIPASDILFVGNSRGVFRKIVKDAMNIGLLFDVYGTGWESFIPKNIIKGQNIPNEELAKYYTKAKIVLNDHWDDMAKNGFISNRLFDVIACGTTVISDDCEGVKELFGNSVMIYNSPSELFSIIKNLRSKKHDYERIRVTEKIISEHTFQCRAERIISRIDLV